MKKSICRITAIVCALLLFESLLLSGALYSADMFICDTVYRKFESQTRDVKIIAIDERAEAEYGKYSEWSREKAAELTELLSSDSDLSPAVITFDIMFIGDSDAETDARLAAACEAAGNVVCASNIVYNGATEVGDDGKLYYNPSAIERIETPYSALESASDLGFANTCISEDNITRYARISSEYNGERIYSLAYSAYIKFAESRGLAVREADDLGQQSGFFYSGAPGDIPHFSIVDVLSGDVPLSEFDDCLVFVGTYAPGFMDAYNTSAARSNQMHGVEINANIVLALLNGKLANPVSGVLYALIFALILGLWMLSLEKQKLWAVITESALMILLHLLAGRILALNGYLIPQLYFIVAIVLIVAVYIVKKYFVERARRRQTLMTLKKYVAPQVVDKLSRSGKFEFRLGGENRHIAVLFVDVRGFTTMSESLAPETVVSILNRYLSVTTDAVFSNEGTLDKFIGDATMAVFNAPFDLDDYIFKAVKTAWDIREGVAALADELELQFGKKVNVGVGVNCGEAVVGNIGCDFRMDYTAIGDTVNTAARLESNAPAGKILISRKVYDAVRDRIVAEQVGELALKGKAEKVEVFSVIGFKSSSEEKDEE